MPATAAISETDGILRIYQDDSGQNFNTAWIDVFLKACKEERKDESTTRKSYKSYLQRFTQWMTDNGIERPTRPDIISYRDYLESSDLALGTQAQYFRAVKLFFHWTAIEGLYDNIADGIKGPKVRHSVHKKDALSRDAVKPISNSIDRTTETGKRDYAIYMICITCGLRCCEISRANVGDLRTLAGKTYLDVQGKGHAEKDASVWIVPAVKEALDDYLKARTAPAVPKSPLFTSTSNNSKGQRIKPQTISVLMKRVLKNAGYDSSRLTAHSLRHTSATGCYRATGDMNLTKEHQRHENISTTEIYVAEDKRESRDDEQLVYNYYFDLDGSSDDRATAHKLIDMISPERLAEVIDTLKKFQ